MGEQISSATRDEPVEDKTWLRLEDTKAIEFMLKLESMLILNAYLEGPKSISEAAQAGNVPFRKMYYLTHKALKLRLLKVGDIQERKGRAVKRYCGAADAFFIPFSLMQKDSREITLEKELQSVPYQVDALLHSSPIKESGSDSSQEEWGRVYKLDERGGMTFFTSSSEKRFTSLDEYEHYLAWEHPKAYLGVTSGNLRLSPEDAKACHRELLALYNKYSKRAGEGPPHFVKLFIAEMPEDA